MQTAETERLFLPVMTLIAPRSDYMAHYTGRCERRSRSHCERQPNNNPAIELTRNTALR